MKGQVTHVGYEITDTGKRYSVTANIKVEFSKRSLEKAEQEIHKLKETLLGKEVLINVL